MPEPRPSQTDGPFSWTERVKVFPKLRVDIRLRTLRPVRDGEWPCSYIGPYSALSRVCTKSCPWSMVLSRITVNGSFLDWLVRGRQLESQRLGRHRASDWVRRLLGSRRRLLIHKRRRNDIGFVQGLWRCERSGRIRSGRVF
jgi:hypothetical protein